MSQQLPQEVQSAAERFMRTLYRRVREMVEEALMDRFGHVVTEAGGVRASALPGGSVTAHVAEADPHTGYQKESEKGAASGYASLDGSGTVPDAQIAATIARDSEVTAAVSAHAGAADPHTAYQRESEKGVASGYASLGVDSLVPMAQLATGTPNGTQFIRDDGTLQEVVTGGQYRTFLWVPDGAGSFDFVVNADGEPVYALADLE